LLHRSRIINNVFDAFIKVDFMGLFMVSQSLEARVLLRSYRYQSFFGERGKTNEMKTCPDISNTCRRPYT